MKYGPNFRSSLTSFVQTDLKWLNKTDLKWLNNAGFRVTCRLPHCRFDDDICSTAQAPLAAEG